MKTELEKSLSIAAAAVLAIAALLCVELWQSRKNERAMNATVIRLTLENMALKSQPSPVAPYVRPQTPSGGAK